MITRTLKLTSEGDDVRELQQKLKQLGFFKSNIIDGYFGAITKAAVCDFQCAKGIVCGGTEATTGWGQVGPKTIAVLNQTNGGLLPKVARMRDQLVKIMSYIEPIRVTSDYRSIQEQDVLYAQGRTKPGSIVTNAKGGQSFHNWRVAFDIVFVNTGYNGNWARLADIAKTLGLEWGGDWTSFPDKPHFQFTAGYSLYDFQSGKIDEGRFA